MSKDEIYAGRISWLVATGGLLVLAVKWFSLVYPFTVVSIMNAFHVGLTVVSLMFSANSVAMLIGSIVAGILMDRYGIKVVGALSAIITGLFVALTGLSPSIYWAIALYGIAGLFSFPPIAPKIAGEWFPERMYARATIYQFIGFYVVSIIMGPLTAFMMTAYGWRSTWIYIGIISIILGVVAFFLLRDRRTPTLTAQQAPRVTIRDAFRYKETWLIFLVALFGFFMPGMFLANLMATWEIALRISTLTASLMWSIATIAGTIGPLILTPLADVVSNRRIMPRKNFTALIFGIAALFWLLFALFMYIMPISLITTIVAAAMFFGQTVVTLPSALVPEYLPREVAATVGGLMLAAQIPLVILPPIAGIIISTFGKIGWIYAWLLVPIGTFLSTLIALFILKPPLTYIKK